VAACDRAKRPLTQRATTFKGIGGTASNCARAASIRIGGQQFVNQRAGDVIPQVVLFVVIDKGPDNAKHFISEEKKCQCPLHTKRGARGDREPARRAARPRTPES